MNQNYGFLSTFMQALYTISILFNITMNILPILDVFENTNYGNHLFLKKTLSNRLTSSIILVSLAVLIQYQLPNMEVLFLLNGSVLLNYLQNILPNKMFIKACDTHQLVLAEDGEIIENPFLSFG